MAEQKCDMVMAEDADFNLTWECSNCGNSFEFSDDGEFEKSQTCPKCGATIEHWASLYDDDEDEEEEDEE